MILILMPMSFVACSDDDDDESYSSSKSNGTVSYKSTTTLDIFYTYVDVANADTTLLTNLEIEQTAIKTYSYESSDGTSYETTDTISYESAQATFYFDGEEVAQLTSSPYSFEYDLSGFSSGEHSVDVDVIRYEEDGETKIGTTSYATTFLVLEPGAINFDIECSTLQDTSGNISYVWLSKDSSISFETVSVTYYKDGELLAETDSYSERVSFSGRYVGHTITAVVLLKAASSDTTLFYFTITSTF